MEEIFETLIGLNGRQLGDLTVADCRAAASRIELGEQWRLPEEDRYRVAWSLRKLAIVMEENTAAAVRDLDPAVVKDIFGSLGERRQNGETGDTRHAEDA